MPRYYDSPEMIGRDYAILGIEESKFKKRKYHKGHHVEGVWVLRIVKRTKLVKLEDRFIKSLKQ